MKFLQDTTFGYDFLCNSFVNVQTVLSITCNMFGSFTKDRRYTLFIKKGEIQILNPNLNKLIKFTNIQSLEWF